MFAIYLIAFRTAVLDVNNPRATMLSEGEGIAVQSTTQPADVSTEPVLYGGDECLCLLSHFHYIERRIYITLKCID